MLLQFNFRNFSSFKNENTLYLISSGISELQDHIRDVGGVKVLPVAAIYGANASGKTNVYEAFKFMNYYVKNSYSFGGDLNIDESYSKPTPFLFSEDSRNDETLFEVYYVDEKDNRTYNYGFTIDADGINEEWLNSKAKTSNEFKEIFYRNNKEDVLEFKKLDKISTEMINRSLFPERLIVSLAGMFEIKELFTVSEWFAKNNFINFGVPSESDFMAKHIPANFSTDRSLRNNIIQYLSSFDDSIKDFEVKEVDSENKKKFEVNAIHKMSDNDNFVSIPLQYESAGTLKMFALYPFLSKALDTGGVLFIDELNSKLHPLLLRIVIQTFTDPNLNKNNAQLIFTTHSTNELSYNLLRRDEIWFTEKKKTGETCLYSLVEFKDTENNKIRKDENYEKNYLYGKYGAIPEVRNLLVREDDE